MAGCRYKTRVLDEEWECPLDALPEGEYCYWHKEMAGKEPTEEQLEELKRKKIFGIYLVMANLQEADLSYANLRNAKLDISNLEGASIMMKNLSESNLLNAQLQCAKLYVSKVTTQVC